MCKVELFARVIDAEPGNKIFYLDAWYHVLKVIKEVIEDDVFDIWPMNKFTLILQKLPEGETYENRI